MKQWFEMTVAEIANDPNARLNRAQAYQDALLATPDGRAVFSDILNMVEQDRTQTTTAASDPAFHLGMQSLVAEIKRRMGMIVNPRLLSVMLPIVREYEPKAPEAPRVNSSVIPNGVAGRTYT